MLPRPPPTPPSSRLPWVAGALVLVVLIAVWIYRATQSPPARTESSARRRDRAQDEPPSTDFEAPDAMGGAPRPLTQAQRQAQEDGVREMIRRAQAAASGEAVSGSDAPPGPLAAAARPLDPLPPPGVLSDGGTPFNDYIKRRIDEDLMPLAGECYETARIDNPTLAGKVLLSFRIVPVARGGSVVQTARVVDDSSTIKDPEFWRCLTESLATVRFGPPSAGYGESSVQYPLSFAPGSPDGG